MYYVLGPLGIPFSPSESHEFKDRCPIPLSVYLVATVHLVIYESNVHNLTKKTERLVHF